MEDCNYSGAREWGRGGGRGERDGLGIQLHHFLRSYDSVFFRTRQCPRASCLGDFSISQLAQLRKVPQGGKKCHICTRMNATPRDFPLSPVFGIWVNGAMWRTALGLSAILCHALPCHAVPRGKTPLPAAAVTPPNFLSTCNRIDLANPAGRDLTDGRREGEWRMQ